MVDLTETPVIIVAASGIPTAVTRITKAVEASETRITREIRTVAASEILIVVIRITKAAAASEIRVAVLKTEVPALTVLETQEAQLNHPVVDSETAQAAKAPIPTDRKVAVALDKLIINNDYK